MKPESVIIQMKATKQYFLVVLIVLNILPNQSRYFPRFQFAWVRTFRGVCERESVNNNASENKGFNYLY